jgi:uncharacterized protein (TIGR02996 family)
LIRRIAPVTITTHGDQIGFIHSPRALTMAKRPVAPTFPTNPALEAAVIAHAEDDTPRLVYADWLDENGDPDRAAYIRNECALWDKSPADPDWIELNERRVEVRAAMSRRRLGPTLPGGVQFWDNIPEEHEPNARYQRGFPYVVGPPPTDDAEGAPTSAAMLSAFPAAVAAAFASTTLRGLQLHGNWSSALPNLTALPEFALCTGLELNNPEPTPILASLLTSSAVPSLRSLELVQIATDASAARLAAARFKSLRRFSSGSCYCERTGIVDFFKAEWLDQLHQATFQFSPKPAKAGIAGLAALPQLHTLTLHQVTKEAWAALATARGFRNLAALSVNSYLQSDLVSALSQARLPALKVLHLDGCHLRSEDVRALVRAPLFAQLHKLSLFGNGIGDQGVITLANAPTTKNLRFLDYGAGLNQIGKGGLAALARPGAFPLLRTLRLRYPKSSVPMKDVASFLGKLAIPTLKHFQFEVLMDNSGLKALAANPNYANLTLLTLFGNFSAKGADLLFHAPHLQRLRSLSVNSGPVGAAAAALHDPGVMPELRHLVLPPGIPSATLQTLHKVRPGILTIMSERVQ